MSSAGLDAAKGLGAIAVALLLCCDSRGVEMEVSEIRVDPDSRLRPGQTVTLSVDATGENLEFEWTADPGELPSNTTAAVVYTAPPTPGKIAVTVTVKSRGRSVVRTGALEVSGSAPGDEGAVSMAIEDLAIPAGWMSGHGSPGAFMDLDPVASDCPGDGGCYKVSHTTGSGWTGIYWWPPTCGDTGSAQAWDRAKAGQCGINILQAGGVRGVTRLVFLARGGSGGERIRFKVGAPDISPSPGVSCPRNRLGADWEEYEINLSSMDLSNSVAVFGWTIEDARNPGGATFEIANIRFEGTR